MLADTSLVWTDERAEQLNALGDLLRAATQIDRGSNAIARIETCINLAEGLLYPIGYDGKDSFYEFLRRQAIENRTYHNTGKGATP